MEGDQDGELKERVLRLLSSRRTNNEAAAGRSDMTSDSHIELHVFGDISINAQNVVFNSSKEES